MTELKNAIVVTDLGFGDCGKGTIVDYLTDQLDAGLVVKLSGGAQCAHNVVTPEGVEHTFTNFGAGTFAGADTYLSRYFLVNPTMILREAQKLENLGVRDPLKRMSVDPGALVTTPVHIAANRLRENARNGALHGSTGMGIGETQADYVRKPMAAMLVRDLLLWHPQMIFRMLKQDRDMKVIQLRQEGIPMEGEPMEFFEDDHLLDYAHNCHNFAFEVGMRRVQWAETTIFEGSQGVLLDQDWGTFPHVTYAKTTGANYLKMLVDEDVDHLNVKHRHVGVMRTYQTRHGAGPLPTYDEELTQALPELHNSNEAYAGAWRCGWLDVPLTRYAINACEADGAPVTDLAITHVDKVAHNWKVAEKYDFFGSPYIVPPINPEPNLADQKAWTRSLEMATPILGDFHNLGRIAKLIRCKDFTIKSYGPNRNQKEGALL